MAGVGGTRSPHLWAVPLQGGNIDLTDCDVDAGPGGARTVGCSNSDLTIAGARVEIRALWSRIHELELELQVCRHGLAELMVQVQVHG